MITPIRMSSWVNNYLLRQICMSERSDIRAEVTEVLKKQSHQ